MIVETCGSILLITIAIILDKFLKQSILHSDFFSNGIANFVYALIFGILFILLSIGTRLIFPKNPEEVTKIKNNNKVVPVGIIDFTWIGLMGFVYAGIIFCQGLEIIADKIELNNATEYYKLYYDETKYLFGQTINLLLVLGTILAACMTIIWSGAIWRKKDNTSRKQYIQTTYASIKMVVAFFIIVISIVIWVSLPLFNKMTILKDFIK